MDHSDWCAVIHTEQHRMQIQMMLYSPEKLLLACLVPKRALPETPQSSHRAAGAAEFQYELLADKQGCLENLGTKHFWQYTEAVNPCVCLML